MPIDNSVVAVRRETGDCIGEYFDSLPIPNFNQEKVALVRTHDHLCRYNDFVAGRLSRSELLEFYRGYPRADLN